MTLLVSWQGVYELPKGRAAGNYETEVTKVVDGSRNGNAERVAASANEWVIRPSQIREASDIAQTGGRAESNIERMGESAVGCLGLFLTPIVQRRRTDH